MGTLMELHCILLKMHPAAVGELFLINETSC